MQVFTGTQVHPLAGRKSWLPTVEVRLRWNSLPSRSKAKRLPRGRWGRGGGEASWMAPGSGCGGSRLVWSQLCQPRACRAQRGSPGPRRALAASLWQCSALPVSSQARGSSSGRAKGPSSGRRPVLPAAESQPRQLLQHFPPKKWSLSPQPATRSWFWLFARPLGPAATRDPPLSYFPVRAQRLTLAEPRRSLAERHRPRRCEDTGRRGRAPPHLQDTDTSTRVAGMAALSCVKPPRPAELVWRLSILRGAVESSGSHIQSPGRPRAPSPAPDKQGWDWGWRQRKEAEAVRGKGEAEKRRISARSREGTGPQELRLLRKRRARLSASLPPQPELSTLRDPPLALGFGPGGATGQPSGLGGIRHRPQPSSRTNRGPAWQAVCAFPPPLHSHACSEIPRPEPTPSHLPAILISPPESAEVPPSLCPQQMSRILASDCPLSAA